MRLFTISGVSFLTLFVFALQTGTLQAQTTTGEITGTVTDPTGAVISDLEVTIVDVATGLSKRTVTNARGVYLILFLNPGRYRLTAEAPGFKRYIRENILMETAQTATLDIPMQLGEVTEVISVTAETPLLESENATLGQVIEAINMMEMPLPQRRAARLAMLMGNVVYVGDKSSLMAIPQFSVGGGPSLDQQWTVDGGNATNNPLDRTQFLAQPQVEALQEVKLLSNIYSAEYGHTRGGHVTLTTKSGTNEFHGSLSHYLRNESLDARPFFSPGVFPRKDNIFGGVIGGPIKRDQTFFYAGLEGKVIRQGATRTLDVPTPEEVEGDFSARSGELLDPATGQPFVNNIIPASRLDPVGAALAKFYPAPNVSGRPSGSRNFARNVVTQNDQQSYTFRVDHTQGEKNNFFGRYLRIPLATTRMQDVFPNPLTDPSITDGTNIENQIMATWTRSITPTFFNDFRFTSNWTPFTFDNAARGSGITGQVGLQGVPPDGMPDFRVDGLTRVGRGSFLITEGRVTQFINAVSWIKASHSIKVGVDYKYLALKETFANAEWGRYSFTDRATGSGFALAALLTGHVNNAFVHVARPRTTRMDYYAFYVQDDWKVTPSLTLNYGVRWDIETARREVSCFQNHFDTTGINPVSGTPGVIRFACVDGEPTTPHDTDMDNFGPRFGFAWRPFGNDTVIRGGYGIMYGPTYSNLGPGRAVVAGFSDERSFRSPDGGFTPAFLLRDGIPGGGEGEPIGPGFGTSPLGAPVRFAPEFFERDRPSPSSHIFSLSVQRQLVSNILFDITYQGNLGHHVVGPHRVNINEVLPELRLGAARADQTLRPFPQFDDVSTVAPPWGNSSYHALNLKLEKRFSSGLSFLGNYTWAKFISDAPNRFDITGSQDRGSVGSQSIYNRASDRGPSGNDIRHRFVWSSVYELPVGKGKPVEIRNAALANIIGGWALGSIIVVRTGAPFGVRMQTNRLNAFSDLQRANVVGNHELSSGRSRGDQVERWFNTGAFAFPGDGIEGNAGPGQLRGAGFANVDLSLLKSVSITERWRLQIRAEFFNAFNRPNFFLPETRLGNSNFGAVSRTVNDGRIVQLGLRLSF